MTYAFSIAELKTIIGELKNALIRAAQSGGVTSYSLNSGQGSTTVHSASMAEIKEQINFFSQMLNEQIEIESGSNMVCVRDLGI